MKIKDIKDKYGEYEIDESKLEELLTPPKPKSVHELKDGDTMYVIAGFGQVYKHTFYGNSQETLNYIECGMAFLTREEAEFKLERMKIEAELIKLGGRVGKGYCLYWNTQPHLGVCISLKKSAFGIIAFETYGECQNAIDVIGEERLKKYYFGVKDEKKTGR